jgi:hypothetical protein
MKELESLISENEQLTARIQELERQPERVPRPKWEKVATDTHRLKVPGGWLVKRKDLLLLVADETPTEISSSMCFVPDPRHEWRFE